jgi:hypothetical protein
MISLKFDPCGFAGMSSFDFAQDSPRHTRQLLVPRRDSDTALLWYFLTSQCAA